MHRAEPDLRGWLDLVVLGTICDVVPLAGLNRAFVAKGIKIAPRYVNPGRAALSLGAAQAELIGHIERLAPFGAGDPEPRFVLPGVRAVHIEAVANGHLSCAMADPADTARLRAIAFRAAGRSVGQFLAETRGAAVHVAGHLRRDTWRGGGEAVQLLIDDAAPIIG